MDKMFNLGDYRTYSGAKVFSGRPRGEEVRRALGLNALDEAGDNVTITIPDDVYTFNMSFFLGLCAPSVVRYGTSEFSRHYHFTGPEVLTRDIPDYVAEAVKEANPLQFSAKKTA